MKQRIVLILALFTFAAFSAFAGITAFGAPTSFPTKIVAPPVVHRTTAGDVFVDADPDPQVVRLATYLDLDVMADWPPAKIPSVDTTPLAFDIARAVLRKPSADPAHDGVMIAALAYVEGARFARYVDSMECNDPIWRKDGVDEGRHVGTQTVGGLRVHGSLAYWTSEELMHIGGVHRGAARKIGRASEVCRGRVAKAPVHVVIFKG